MEGGDSEPLLGPQGSVAGEGEATLGEERPKLVSELWALRATNVPQPLRGRGEAACFSPYRKTQQSVGRAGL